MMSNTAKLREMLMRTLLIATAWMIVMSSSGVSQAEQVPLVYSFEIKPSCAEVLDKGKIIARSGNASAHGLPNGMRTYIWYDGLIWDIFFPQGTMETPAFYCNPTKPIWNKSN
jgi:hypothetical protein